MARLRSLLAIALLIVGFLLLALASGPTFTALAPCEASPTVTGVVAQYDETKAAGMGEPINGATVTYRALDYNATYSTVTDGAGEGRYSITITKPAGRADQYERFNITVEAPGYDTVYLGTSVCGDQERNVVMNPASAPPTPPPQPQPAPLGDVQVAGSSVPVIYVIVGGVAAIFVALLLIRRRFF